MAWIRTYTGIRFELVNPTVDMIDIRDIAHALSMQARFNGHTREFYSVAQHSVFVASHCDPRNALQGLLHDASEAYTGDIVTPVKRTAPGFFKVERQIWGTIAERFEVGLELTDDVKWADKLALATEAKFLLGYQLEDDIALPTPAELTYQPLTPGEAEQLFLRAFEMTYREKR